MNARDLNDWGVDIEDAKKDIMLTDEWYEFDLIERHREIESTLRSLAQPFIWDSPIVGEWLYE